MKRLLSVLVIALIVAAGVPSLAQAQDRTVGERVDDAKITAAVKTKLTADSAKNLVNVDVDTKQGVVHLQGMVPTEQDKQNAEQLARSATGVVEVKNDLKVAGGASSPTPSASPSTK